MDLETIKGKIIFFSLPFQPGDLTTLLQHLTDTGHLLLGEAEGGDGGAGGGGHGGRQGAAAFHSTHCGPQLGETGEVGKTLTNSSER